MKKKLLLAVCVFVLAVTTTLVIKANARANAYYTDADAPGFCFYPQALPSGCSVQVTGTICRSTGNLFTYYKESACSSPFYRQQ
ncbi:MAG TPA: hypothetical protein VGD35_08855 [Chitinophaga sp.]